MSFSPVADMKFHKLTDINTGHLKSRGIKLLILDIDNTLSPYRINEPTDEIRRWAENMKNSGIQLFFVSNNRGDRPASFSNALDIPYIKRALKPSRKGVIAAMEKCSCTPAETALAGDQSYTDVLCANRCGVTSILVEPISLKNPLLAIRYFFELPFRAAAREKF